MGVIPDLFLHQPTGTGEVDEKAIQLLKNATRGFPVPQAPGTGVKLDDFGQQQITGDKLAAVIPRRKPNAPEDFGLEAQPTLLDRVFDLADNTFNAGLDVIGDRIAFERWKEAISVQAKAENIRDDRLSTGIDPVTAVNPVQAGISPMMAIAIIGGAALVGLVLAKG